jgi:hypothetical protein
VPGGFRVTSLPKDRSLAVNVAQTRINLLSIWLQERLRTSAAPELVIELP